jgi:DNA-binding XRE family transcriptional regulator
MAEKTLPPKITLKAARVNVGLTQIQAAKLAGVHHQKLQKYEVDSDDIPRSLAKKLANIYGYPIDNIFFGTDIALKRYIDKISSVNNFEKHAS